MAKRAAMGPLAPLFLTVFIDLLGFGIAIPLLPFYAQRFGASPDTVTLVIAIYSLAQFIVLPFWGRLSDRLGRRRVLLVALAGGTCANVWLAFVDSLAMLFVARAFAGCMAGNAGVAQAYVADTTTAENRARGHGIIGAAFGLGFLCGPAVGGLLAGAGTGDVDYRTPFLAAAALSAAAFLFAALRLPESVGAAQRAVAAEVRRGRFAEIAEALRRPHLGLLVALMFFTPFVFSGVETTFALWSERALGWGPLENGYAYSFMGAVAVIVQGGLAGPLSRRFGERRLVIAGPVIVAAGALALPLIGGIAGVALSLFLVVAGVCIVGPALMSLTSQRAGSHERGRVLGYSQASGGLARILGPAWAGYGFVAVGRDWPYVSGAVIMAMMLVLALRIARPAQVAAGKGAGSGA
jgi:DHA1 family tetracycline resistance protein-like MFS transporter